MHGPVNVKEQIIQPVGLMLIFDDYPAQDKF